jgi:phosphorylcholine metabolism protein LicD
MNKIKEDNFKKCLEEMKEILENNNQTFFLACGTLLGCYREKKFISYDGDIDIGILEEDFDINIVNKILDTKKYKLSKKYGSYEKKNLEYTFTHTNGIRIDIFIYYKIKDNFYYTSTFNDICSKKKDGFCKWGRHISGFKETEFYGKKYLIPSNVEEHLIDSYGEDYMKPKKFSYSEGVRGLYKSLLN